jgi:hypothetical protein
MNDLNLLPSEAKFQAERMHLKKIINDFLWIFGGIWLLFLLIIFVVNFILQLFLNKLNSDYQKSLNQYQSLVGSMAINQKVKYQAKIVGKVLTGRFKYGESMEKVKTLFSDNIVIKNLEIQEIKKFMIYGSVKNGEGLSEVESKVADINKDLMDGFKSAKIMDLSVDAVKGWLFNMEVVLK